MQGKQHKDVPKKIILKARKKNELIHSNICGPLPCQSLSRSRYFITFTNDYSYKTWTYFLKTRSRALEKFKEFK
jgi:hypothetical protein